MYRIGWQTCNANAATDFKPNTCGDIRSAVARQSLTRMDAIGPVWIRADPSLWLGTLTAHSFIFLALASVCKCAVIVDGAASWLDTPAEQRPAEHRATACRDRLQRSHTDKATHLGDNDAQRARTLHRPRRSVDTDVYATLRR